MQLLSCASNRYLQARSFFKDVDARGMSSKVDSKYKDLSRQELQLGELNFESDNLDAQTATQDFPLKRGVIH